MQTTGSGSVDKTEREMSQILQRAHNTSNTVAAPLGGSSLFGENIRECVVEGSSGQSEGNRVKSIFHFPTVTVVRLVRQRPTATYFLFPSCFCVFFLIHTNTPETTSCRANIFTAHRHTQARCTDLTVNMIKNSFLSINGTIARVKRYGERYGSGKCVCVYVFVVLPMQIILDPLPSPVTRWNH